jgi:hypothetical protein
MLSSVTDYGKLSATTVRSRPKALAVIHSRGDNDGGGGIQALATMKKGRGKAAEDPKSVAFAPHPLT